MNKHDIEIITRGYIDAASWLAINADTLESEGGCEGVAMTKKSEREAFCDCRDFINHAIDLEIDCSDLATEQTGHDFWLSRNGHGAGFFDGDYKEGDALQRAARSFGSVDCVWNPRSEMLSFRDC